MAPLRIAFLVPEMYGSPGGLAVFMCRIREVLSDYARTHDAEVDCISLNDLSDDPAVRPRSIAATRFSGCGRSKPAFVWRLIQGGMRRPYDFVVVGHLGQSPAAHWAKMLGGIGRYAITLCGQEAWERVGILERAAAQSATLIIGISRYTASHFAAANGIDQNRLRILPLSVAECRADLRTPPPHPSNANGEFSLLSVGRLAASEGGKGMDTLIAAMPAIKAAIANAHLSIVGGGDDLPRLQALANKLAVNGSVSFLGQVDDATLHRLYESCDVFAMPSRQEGFGIVYLEAMVRGKPCLGGAHGGAPEVVRHGETGFVVPFGDVESLAEHAIRLARDPQLRQRMGNAAFRLVVEEYAYDCFAENLTAILQELSCDVDAPARGRGTRQP